MEFAHSKQPATDADIEKQKVHKTVRLGRVGVPCAGILYNDRHQRRHEVTMAFAPSRHALIGFRFSEIISRS